MGDVSIIARRLPGGYVQYGWSGNGGYYRMVGARLDEWYQTAEDVEYLFGLGQTRLIGQKGSEKGGFSMFETHQLTHEPFWLGRTEREIFSKIAFIDYGYFYDLDNKWYYVIPGPFRIKIPFSLIKHSLENAEYEFDYCKFIKKRIVEYIFTEYKACDKCFADFLVQNGYIETNSIINKVMNSVNSPVYELYDKYMKIFGYFDDWVVIVADERGNEIEQIIMKRKEQVHIETNNWVS